MRNALRGRIAPDEATAKFGGLNMTMAELRQIDHIVIPACGTSWHAALIGEYLFEEFAHIPTEVEYASEFRYRNAPIEKNTLVLMITQSGETADTLAGLRESKPFGQHAVKPMRKSRSFDVGILGRIPKQNPTCQIRPLLQIIGSLKEEWLTPTAHDKDQPLRLRGLSGLIGGSG